MVHRGTLWVGVREAGESLPRISPPKAAAAIRLRSMSVAKLASLKQGERPTIGSAEGS